MTSSSPTPPSMTQPFLTRRGFLRAAGLTLAGSALAVCAKNGLEEPPRPVFAQSAQSGLPEHPNILILITDQERAPQHWPANWDYEHLLPARWRLAQKGISFNRNYCNSAMCSPSRANFFTGLFPENHGLKRTLTYGQSLSSTEVALSPQTQNMARMLASAGYRVSLKGKWHLSKHADGTQPTAQDVADFGFLDWEATTVGEATDPADFGGGCANGDQDIASQAVNYLRNYKTTYGSQPFALIVSLANPHDLLSYPKTWDDETEPGCFNYKTSANFSRNIELPPTLSEDLSTKPSVQQASRDIYAASLGTLLQDGQKPNYVNFYADLQILVDQHIQAVLNELDTQNLTNDTIIIRMSDHGEMGLSHGGLRQKMFNAYEETTQVPLVISNPLLFSSPVECDALTSLVDVMPTLATLAKVPKRSQWLFAGRDLTPLIDNPAGKVQNAILFTFDDDRAGTGYDIPTIAEIAHHLHAMVLDDPTTGTWKIVRYFNPEANATEEYELYHLRHANGTADDEYEAYNLASNPAYTATLTTLKTRLTQEETDRFHPGRVYLPAITR